MFTYDVLRVLGGGQGAVWGHVVGGMLTAGVTLAGAVGS